MIESCPCDSCTYERNQLAAQQPKEEVKEVPTSRTLTREMVLKGDPCGYYRRQFVSRFPESVEVTEGLAVSQANDWDWWWAASHLLSSGAYSKFRDLAREAEVAYTDTLEPYHNVVRATKKAIEAERTAYYNKLVKGGANFWSAQDLSYEFSSKLAEVAGPHVDIYNSDVRKAAEQARVEAYARAWAGLFLSDKDAYEEQHKNDEPFEDSWTEEDYAEEEG